MGSYTYKRKFFSKIIITLLYISFIILLLDYVQNISNYNDTIHISIIPVFLIMFVCPILLVFWIFFGIKSIKENDEINLKSKVINAINTVFCILIIFYYVIYSSYTSVSRLYVIEDKVKEQGYYVVIDYSNDDLRLKCRKNEFYLIEKGKEYLISFKVYRFFNIQAELEYIDRIE